MAKKGRHVRARQKRNAASASSANNNLNNNTTKSTTSPNISTLLELIPPPRTQSNDNTMLIANHTDSREGYSGWMYSYGHGLGRPEYYVADVPSNNLEKQNAVCATINFIADDYTEFGHRHSIRGAGNLLFWLRKIDDEATIKELLRTKCLLMNNFSKYKGKMAPIYELRPLFDECTHLDSWWGCRPPAPAQSTSTAPPAQAPTRTRAAKTLLTQQDTENMVDDILCAWEMQRTFTLEGRIKASEMGDEFMEAGRILFRDFDEHKDDVYIPRAKVVDLTIALRHVDDGTNKGDNIWKVDWDKELTEEQIQYVRGHTKYFRWLARKLFRTRSICEHCGKLEDLMKCSRCNHTHYCGRECQVADWKSHKKDCKRYQDMRKKTFGAVTFGAVTSTCTD
mmetsp:Transcript_3458/g.4037  ORF Transcript_3458/g.4037 Transcript_3458/m.4037 type:complete len:395 (+) Transcript_3458:74-1258(+)